MNYSFFELQNQYNIMIPQIQRDYAQGREDKSNDNKIKSYDFIVKIIEVLTSDDLILNLDFVYGYTKEIAKDQFAFIPLDGQQRLTTLWLLHWYLSPKQEAEQSGIKIMSVTEEVKKWLNKFTYETRNSSKRFCEELTDKPLPLSDDVCTTIKDANWFMASWQNDPTVVSMLNMLNTIQKCSFDKEKAWKNLFENRRITFDYIDIKSNEFKLTDELYIKMNSRGKPLTSFENFKAQFSEILSDKNTDYIDDGLDYEGTKISFQKYFAFKIDTVWTDLFWNFVMCNELKIQEIMKDKKNSEDEDAISYVFMNFFTCIAQMCYFKDNTNKNAEDFKKDDFSVFKKKDNVVFLFEVLNFFHKISMGEAKQVKIDNINVFFESVFQKGEINGSYQGQVRIFEDNRVNLFENCLLEGQQFDNRNRIILYCLVSYMIKYRLTGANNELRYYVRVVRNLLQATRQKNEIVYNTNVRINSFGNYWKLFNRLQEKSNVYKQLLENISNKETSIGEDALNNEKEKAQIITDNISSKPEKIQALFLLEEFKYFGGLIHNLNPKENNGKFIDWSNSVKEIWSCNDNLIIASLIVCGFRGFYTKYCGLGEMYFWGQKDNWNAILAGQKRDDGLSESIVSLLEKYNTMKLSKSALKPQEILEDIVQEFLDSSTEKNWQYYFCKYKKYFLARSNYYSWNSDEFEHEILGSTGYNPLLSYHINPYVKTVSNLLDDSICKENSCYARYSDESCLVLENGFVLYSKQDGWHIGISEGKTIPKELKEKYGINEQNVFAETDREDRIEIAIDCCRDLVSL